MMFQVKKMSDSVKDRSNKARAQILNKLKTACENKNGLTAQSSQSVRVFPDPVDLLDTFINEFTKVNGKVLLCNGEDEVYTNLSEVVRQRKWSNVFCNELSLKNKIENHISLILNEQITDAEVGVTRCEALIARSGSVLVSSSNQSGRLSVVFPPVHIVLAKVSQLRPFLEDAISLLKEKYRNNWPSQATVITGPSRTADIEKTLVMGAHGPKEILILIDQNS